MIASRQLFLGFLLASLPAQDKELALVFQRYDGNGDGVLLRAEFPGSDEQFTAMDSDKNGKITLAEFEKSAVARRIAENRRRDLAPPRARLDPLARSEQRFEALARIDKNRDGRITRDEWNGAPEGFAALDADGNQVLDAADREAARRREEAEPAAMPALPAEFKALLPPAEELLKRLDDDKDQKLSKAEAGTSKLAPVFGLADTSKDGFLDLDELRRILDRVNRAVLERNKGYEKPRAYEVPFDAWDKNKDERLDSNEFLERKDLFARIDADRDSAVTRAELARYRKSIEGESFLERFDLDGDGKVTLEEFGGSIDAFRRLDKNGDGAVSAADR